MDEFKNHQENTSTNKFSIKIWDVSLDIDKELFEIYLTNLEDVNKVIFRTKNLYYDF